MFTMLVFNDYKFTIEFGVSLSSTFVAASSYSNTPLAHLNIVLFSHFFLNNIQIFIFFFLLFVYGWLSWAKKSTRKEIMAGRHFTLNTLIW